MPPYSWRSRSGTHGVRLSWVNLDRRALALDEVVVAVECVLLKVSLSLLLPLWRERFSEPALELIFGRALSGAPGKVRSRPVAQRIEPKLATFLAYISGSAVFVTIVGSGDEEIRT
jgi:hypothetical protein